MGSTILDGPENTNLKDSVERPKSPGSNNGKFEETRMPLQRDGYCRRFLNSVQGLGLGLGDEHCLW